MAAPNPLPQFVYKITPTAPPEPIPAEYPFSELDQKDGFVHLSTGWQIPITADLFFKDATTIWILKLRLAHFAGATRWDAPSGPGCPHLYGNFGAGDVEATREFRRGEGQSWAEVFREEGAAGWLS